MQVERALGRIAVLVAMVWPAGEIGFARATLQDSGTESPAWWELGFGNGRWAIAAEQLQGLSKRDRPAAHALLLQCVRGEMELAYRAQHVDETVPAHFPFPGGWGGDALTMQKPQALRWAEWLLRAAPGGRDEGAAHAVLAHLREPRTRGPYAHGTEEGWWTTLVAGVDALLSVSGGDPDEIFEVLAGTPQSGWTVQEQGLLPETVEGRLVLQKDKRWEIKRPLTVPVGAELWIERGAEVHLSNRELPLDPRYGDQPAGPSFIRCLGNIRTFGDSEEPARLILRRVPEDHPDKVRALRMVDSFQALQGIEVQFKDSATACIGIYANSSLWLRDCRFITPARTKDKRQHLGVFGGGPNPPTVFYFENCRFEGLWIGMQYNRSSVWSVHNSFTKNEIGVNVGGMNYLLFLSHDDFRDNDFDLYDSNPNRGRVKMRHCNITGQVQLRQEAEKEYDLSDNWWRKGREHQIVDFDEGGAFRAILGSPRKKRAEQSGAR